MCFKISPHLQTIKYLPHQGLLLRSMIRSEDLVVFLEPKAVYRAAIEDVRHLETMNWSWGKAEIMRAGSDVADVGWGIL